MGCNFAFVLCCILLVSCPSTILSKTSDMARALLVEKKTGTSFHKNSEDGSGTVDATYPPYPTYPTIPYPTPTNPGHHG